MSFMGADFYKELSRGAISDNSETSDVNPEEIAKMLKSANDLDKEIFGFEPVEEKKPVLQTETKKVPATTGAKSLGGNIQKARSFLDFDTPNPDSSLSDEEFAAATKIPVSKPKKEATPTLGRNAAPVKNDKETDKKKGSSDWLGLKESPLKTPERKMKESLVIPQKTVDRKSTLLEELFPQEDKKPNPVVKETTSPVKESSNTPSYEPSLGSVRRPGRRKDPVVNTSSTTFDDGLDWLMGPERSRPRSQTAPSKSVLEVGEDKEDWLEDGIASKPRAQSTPTLARRTVSFTEPSKQRSPTPESAQSQEPHVQESHEDDDKEEVVQLLTTVESQLGRSMDRHQRNLKKYLKVLISEAERVHSVRDSKMEETEPFNLQEAGEQKKESTLEEVDSLANKSDFLKDQEDYIQELKMVVQRLEMQNAQLEMKIDNNKELHDLQISNLNTAHAAEIEMWVARVKRLENEMSVLQAEYEKKIERIRSNEAELEKSYKERLENLQADRLSDLKQSSDFHRIAMEHATSLAVYLPNLGRIPGGGLRLPLKNLERPADEEELTDREKDLMEKERQLEVLRADLRSQKEELAELIEKEKSKREERDRELKRALAEAKFKEEILDKELEAEKQHINILRAQLEELRENALKEFTELTKEKLTLAAEKARLEAGSSIHGGGTSFDALQARTELEAALSAAREAREAAESERRKNIELRRTVEAISWEQQDKDTQLETRERYIQKVLQDAEMKKQEGLKALEEAQKITSEVDERENQIKELKAQMEEKERELAKNRLELAREKSELDRKRNQLELLLPELNPSESLILNPSKNYVDPKALIMRLKAEKDLESFFLPQRKF